MTRIPTEKIAGWLAIMTLATHFLAVAGGVVPADVVTLFAWSTMLTMLPSLKSSARKQSLTLFLLGVSGVMFGVIQGANINWRELFGANVPLLTLFVAISFLSLTNKPVAEESLPTGSKAAAITAFGVTLLGAVINLSVLLVFGDRLKRHGKLTDAQQILLARCFTTAAWWSPFFIATGVALMYSPGMQWKAVVLPGVVMALLGIGYTLLDIKRRGSAQFEGYPLKAESLVIPVLLAISVLLVHHYYPAVSIIILISVLSLVGSLLFMQARPRVATIKIFIEQRLVNAGSQFALFLAAGVFSTGIKIVLSLNPQWVDLHQFSFDGTMFAIISAAMIVAGLIGVHPVISIAIMSPILLPLNPNTTSLGFMFLSTWAISTGSGPLSGVGLVLTGRYGASARSIVANNWHYVVVMWALASAVNLLLFVE